MLTDCYLYLDRLLDKKVFKPQQDESRMVMAGREGVKAKRCLGALRALWRSSKKAWDPRIQDLKACLERSPARRSRSPETSMYN